MSDKSTTVHPWSSVAPQPILASAASYLRLGEKLTLFRRVCRSWSAASRMSLSWSPRVWNVHPSATHDLEEWTPRSFNISRLERELVANNGAGRLHDLHVLIYGFRESIDVSMFTDLRRLTLASKLDAATGAIASAVIFPRGGTLVAVPDSLREVVIHGRDHDDVWRYEKSFPLIARNLRMRNVTTLVVAHQALETPETKDIRNHFPCIESLTVPDLSDLRGDWKDPSASTLPTTLRSVVLTDTVKHMGRAGMSLLPSSVTDLDITQRSCGSRYDKDSITVDLEHVVKHTPQLRRLRVRGPIENELQLLKMSKLERAEFDISALARIPDRARREIQCADIPRWIDGCPALRVLCVHVDSKKKGDETLWKYLCRGLEKIPSPEKRPDRVNRVFSLVERCACCYDPNDDDRMLLRKRPEVLQDDIDLPALEEIV